MRGVIAIGALAALSGGAQVPARDPIVEAAAAYVRQYQQELTSVVAQETYTQRVLAQVPRDSGMPERRTLKSEIFFLFAPGHDWMAIREVTEMDQLPVAERLDLRAALQTLSAPEVARKFKAYNSRYNLGRIERNFNEPTLSLLVLDDRHRARFSFDRVRTTRIGGEERVVLAFRERKAPTLIWDLQGEPVFSSGELTIEPKSGRVTRAMLSLKIGSAQMTLTTTYGFDERLGIWVPVRFGEHYRDGTDARVPQPRGVRTPTVTATQYFEEVVCEARYSAFRKFEVKARIR